MIVRSVLGGLVTIVVLLGVLLGVGYYNLFYAECPSNGSSAVAKEAAKANFVFDTADFAAKSRVIIFIPGALNSIDIFASARSLETQGFALVFYRFPGMDGRRMDTVVDINEIAQQVLDFTTAAPDKNYYLVGFSIGGQVAIEAAARGKDRIKKVAVLAGSLGFPDTFGVGLRAMSWVARGAWTRSTLDFGSIWKDYYKVLLFGEAGAYDPELSKRADAIVATRKSKIVTPTRALVCSHMRDITFRSAVTPSRISDTPILFVHGRSDVVSPYARVGQYSTEFKSAEIKVLENQGHQIFLTEDGLFNQVGAFFLK